MSHDSNNPCAVACSDCQRECDACAHHCAKMVASGKHEHMATLASCLDCADLCAAASRIVARDGVYASLICRACANACAACAKACAAISSDAMMKACADECLKCEKACRAMLTS